ncbi:hypothetical protein COEREDRAFT_6939 [Coemansia reversa NRRL 1564]|uniref:RGS domain-containing protein n=1 Tax=Coemansia reversa (strain ATCC 12441 / NRRL 1564) TaxID=763665 RepID=A0A2G5BGS9_COERN|nr:hypothetical protein COEREDRAFT_6939 [Coemansia reversa NRRL 1564]|eukprot:PIA18205.1 hypothetical protein COEREDRAFT_6939 [Coemansia reversa NRRL 1564]
MTQSPLHPSTLEACAGAHKTLDSRLMVAGKAAGDKSGGRATRRSLSESLGQEPSRVGGARSRRADTTVAATQHTARREARTHQRATSTSSLAAAIPGSPSLAAKRGARLTSVLRAGLRIGSAARGEQRARARAATEISAGYISVAMAGGVENASETAASASAKTAVETVFACTEKVDAGGKRLACSGDIGGDTTAVESGFRARKRSLSVGGESSCGAFFARQIEQYGLQALLTSPVATCYFLASTIGNYSPETLLFYLETEHYRTASFADVDRRTRYAKGLYKAFVSHRTPLEINISHSMRQRITGVFRAAEPAVADMFQETQAHALALLDQDFTHFRQRPLYCRMMAELASPPATGPSARKDTRAQHVRAVAAVYSALASTYGVHTLPSSKSALVASEAPLFTKFADMELTSPELRVALPAWLCRITVRLLDIPLPSSQDELRAMLRLDGNLPVSSYSIRPPISAPVARPLAGYSAAPTSRPAAMASAPSTARADSTPVLGSTESASKKATKQASLQRLRSRFQASSTGTSASRRTDTPLSAPAAPRSRWGPLWISRRRRP